MSQSKASSAAKSASGKTGAPKAKAKPASAKKKAGDLVTVRVIEAPVQQAGPVIPLTAAEQARSDRALALAADIERAIREGKEATGLSPEAVQAMLAALCKIYSAHVEAGERYDAFSLQTPVTPTDVMVTASGLLKAANLAVFELGMWQSWTGR